jgi:outer membrane protein assembly factor BamB
LVFAGDINGRLHAVYVASGQAAWVYEGVSSVIGAPAVSGGSVVMVQADGTITALRTTDGALLWKRSPSSDGGSETTSDGAAVGDGKVFYVRGDGTLLTLSLENGKELWAYKSEGDLRSAPLFADGLVWLGEQNGKFSVIDPNSGKRLWGGGAGGAINTPSVSDGDVYYSSWDGSVQRVRVKGVIPQWKANIGEPAATAPSVYGDTIIVGSANGKAIAFAKADGHVKWSFDTGGGAVSGAPIPADGLVFVGGGNGMLSILDAASGTLRSTFQTGGEIRARGAFADGVLFLGSADGNVYAIR